jgi:glycerophosphoryl diester phosphodiesterase
MAQTTLDSIYQGKPLVFGHRGAKAYAPMNTLPAFELAAQQGADGVELDVQFSKDRALVVIHDFTVDSTTNGEGRVRDMTLAQLKELDAGSWFGDAFKDTRIPTLDEVFEAVGNHLFINVEIKVESNSTDGIEQAVADLIARRNVQRRVIVSSFDLPVLERLRKIAPGIPIGFLHFNLLREAEISRLRDLDFEAIHPHHLLIDSEYMAWAHTNGYRVNTWTVNEHDRALELRNLGVAAVISDNPDVILNALGRSP